MSKISASALAESLELLARTLHARGYAEELFPAQWTALRYFARTPPPRCTASDLARFQGLANGPVSRTVRTLIHKGLLAKAATQPRGRAEVLEVTVTGLAMLEIDPTLAVQAAIDAVDEPDREALARTLQALLDRLCAAPR